MAETKGVDGVVKVASNGGTVATMAHVTAFSLEETTETLDVTSMGDTSREILTTFKAFSGSIDCYWDMTPGVGYSDELAHGADTDPTIQAGTTIQFELYPAGATGSYYAGSAIVTSISRSASFDGAVEMSIAFEGTGDLTYEHTGDA